MLAVLAGAVKASVQEANPLFQVVSVQRHHSVSHHLLLPDETLQLVAFERLQPAGGLNEVFGMSFEIPCTHTHSGRIGACLEERVNV